MIRCILFALAISTVPPTLAYATDDTPIQTVEQIGNGHRLKLPIPRLRRHWLTKQSGLHNLAVPNEIHQGSAMN
jgi:hypothetical protein